MRGHLYTGTRLVAAHPTATATINANITSGSRFLRLALDVVLSVWVASDAEDELEFVADVEAGVAAVEGTGSLAPEMRLVAPPD